MESTQTNSTRSTLSDDGGTAVATDGNDDAAQNKQRSAEILRLTLPMISRHGASYAPASYAVWYEYVRGENRELREELDKSVTADQSIDDAQAYEIYQRHIIGDMERAVHRGRAELIDVLEDVDSSVNHASDSTAHFDEQLGTFARSIDTPLSVEQVREHVSSFKQELTEVKQSMSGLHDKLEDSRTEIKRLASELIRAREQAKIDALSGLLNRRGFDEALELAIKAFCAQPAENQPKPLALLILDIDLFKKINDEHGHLFGDKVIQTVSRLLDQGVMRKDAVGRLGGEEFGILLPETNAAGAMAVAERVRVAVAQSETRRAGSDIVLRGVTVSGGMAIYRRGDTLEQFIARADEALYVAKNDGRNRIQAEPDVDINPTDLVQNWHS